MATMSPEGLDDWLGNLGAPTNTGTSSGDTRRTSQGSLTENSDQDAWTGVRRVAPRPLPDVTGVVGPALAGALQHLDMSVLSPASWLKH
jgi:hypothetical protein